MFQKGNKKTKTTDEAKDETTGEQEEETAFVRKNDWGEFFYIISPMITVFVVLLLILAGFLWVSKVYWGSRAYDRTCGQKTAKAETANIAPRTVEQTAIVSWEKSQRARGGNFRLKSFSASAVVQRNDERFMEFTSSYQWNNELHQTHFLWDKTKKYGDWYQDSPQNSDKWYLSPVSEKHYEGKEYDSRGESARLVLDIG